jgi:hypothetical protein
LPRLKLSEDIVESLVEVIMEGKLLKRKLAIRDIFE